MTTDPLWFLASLRTSATDGAEVLAPNRPPWLQAPPLRYHEATTVVVYSPDIVRAADPPPRR